MAQSVFGRLAGYEDVNDTERLSHDPVMRAIVDRKRRLSLAHLAGALSDLKAAHNTMAEAIRELDDFDADAPESTEETAENPS